MLSTRGCLPPGWCRVEIPRRFSKTSKKYDVYFYSKDGVKLRSFPEIEKYFHEREYLKPVERSRFSFTPVQSQIFRELVQQQGVACGGTNNTYKANASYENELFDADRIKNLFGNDILIGTSSKVSSDSVEVSNAHISNSSQIANRFDVSIMDTSTRCVNKPNDVTYEKKTKQGKRRPRFQVECVPKKLKTDTHNQLEFAEGREGDKTVTSHKIERSKTKVSKRRKVMAAKTDLRESNCICGNTQKLEPVQRNRMQRIEKEYDEYQSLDGTASMMHAMQELEPSESDKEPNRRDLKVGPNICDNEHSNSICVGRECASNICNAGIAKILHTNPNDRSVFELTNSYQHEEDTLKIGNKEKQFNKVTVADSHSAVIDLKHLKRTNASTIITRSRGNVAKRKFSHAGDVRGNEVSLKDSTNGKNALSTIDKLNGKCGILQADRTKIKKAGRSLANPSLPLDKKASKFVMPKQEKHRCLTNVQHRKKSVSSEVIRNEAEKSSCQRVGKHGRENGDSEMAWVQCHSVSQTKKVNFMQKLCKKRTTSYVTKCCGDLKGWTRMVTQRQSGSTRGTWDVLYLSPDNTRLRSRPDVERFLNSSKFSKLNVDMFCFRSSILNFNNMSVQSKYFKRKCRHSRREENGMKTARGKGECTCKEGSVQTGIMNVREGTAGKRSALDLDEFAAKRDKSEALTCSIECNSPRNKRFVQNNKNVEERNTILNEKMKRKSSSSLMFTKDSAGEGKMSSVKNQMNEFTSLRTDVDGKKTVPIKHDKIAINDLQPLDRKIDCENEMLRNAIKSDSNNESIPSFSFFAGGENENVDVSNSSCPSGDSPTSSTLVVPETRSCASVNETSSNSIFDVEEKQFCNGCFSEEKMTHLNVDKKICSEISLKTEPNIDCESATTLSDSVLQEATLKAKERPEEMKKVSMTASQCSIVRCTQSVGDNGTSLTMYNEEHSSALNYDDASSVEMANDTLTGRSKDLKVSFRQDTNKLDIALPSFSCDLKGNEDLMQQSRPFERKTETNLDTLHCKSELMMKCERKPIDGRIKLEVGKVMDRLLSLGIKGKEDDYRSDVLSPDRDLGVQEGSADKASNISCHFTNDSSKDLSDGNVCEDEVWPKNSLKDNEIDLTCGETLQNTGIFAGDPSSDNGYAAQEQGQMNQFETISSSHRKTGAELRRSVSDEADIKKNGFVNTLSKDVSCLENCSISAAKKNIEVNSHVRVDKECLVSNNEVNSLVEPMPRVLRRKIKVNEKFLQFFQSKKRNSNEQCDSFIFRRSIEANSSSSSVKYSQKSRRTSGANAMQKVENATPLRRKTRENICKTPPHKLRTSGSVSNEMTVDETDAAIGSDAGKERTNEQINSEGQKENNIKTDEIENPERRNDKVSKPRGIGRRCICGGAKRKENTISIVDIKSNQELAYVSRSEKETKECQISFNSKINKSPPLVSNEIISIATQKEGATESNSGGETQEKGVIFKTVYNMHSDETDLTPLSNHSLWGPFCKTTNAGECNRSLKEGSFRCRTNSKSPYFSRGYKRKLMEDCKFTRIEKFHQSVNNVKDESVGLRDTEASDSKNESKRAVTEWDPSLKFNMEMKNDGTNRTCKECPIVDSNNTNAISFRVETKADDSHKQSRILDVENGDGQRKISITAKRKAGLSSAEGQLECGQSMSMKPCQKCGHVWYGRRSLKERKKCNTCESRIYPSFIRLIDYKKRLYLKDENLGSINFETFNLDTRFNDFERTGLPSSEKDALMGSLQLVKGLFMGRLGSHDDKEKLILRKKPVIKETNCIKEQSEKSVSERDGKFETCGDNWLLHVDKLACLFFQTRACSLNVSDKKSIQYRRLGIQREHWHGKKKFRKKDLICSYFDTCKRRSTRIANREKAADDVGREKPMILQKNSSSMTSHRIVQKYIGLKLPKRPTDISGARPRSKRDQGDRIESSRKSDIKLELKPDNVIAIDRCKMQHGKHTTVVYKPPKSPYGLIQEQLYNDPWRLLVATIFLNKTTGKVAIPVLWKFFELWPDPQSTMQADRKEIAGNWVVFSSILVGFKTAFLVLC